MEIAIQRIGWIGILMSVISFQCRKHKHILFFRTLNELLFAVQYLALGTYAGAAANILVCVRNGIFSAYVEKNRNTQIPVLIFCLIFVGFGLLTWQGLTSLMIIFVKVLSTLAYGHKNPRILRLITLCTSSGWLVFNLAVGSCAGILCEMVTLASVVTGLLRFDLLPRLSLKFAKDPA